MKIVGCNFWPGWVGFWSRAFSLWLTVGVYQRVKWWCNL